MDNDSDFHMRGRDGLRWGKELRPRYSSNRYRTMDRVSRHPVRSCSLRLRESRIYDDDIDDSDIASNDDEDDDDDDAIFTPVKSKRKFSSERRIAERAMERRNLRSSLNRHSVNDGGQEKVIENGIKEEENDQDVEGEGVRRSKRQRKLLYDNFNQSWILGTQTVLRGYPPMDRGQENTEGDVGSSNEEVPREEVQQPEENDTKPLVNDSVDVYTKIKRTRRQRIPYSPPEITVKPRLRERRARVTVNADSSESEPSQVSSDEGGVARRRRRDDSSDEFTRRQDTGRYHLRQNKPAVNRFQVSSNNQPTRRSSRLVLCAVRSRRYQRKTGDSSSSDEERFQRKKAKSLAKARSRCMPLNYKPDSAQLQKTPVHSSKAGTGISGPKGPADVDPMILDKSIGFDKVGGLEDHLRCLKEMVVFPMMYREIYEKFQMQPPKGVLFHGPPGTGKTLIARALANECSQGDRKVAFFMRKGADCLSKWVGESERQLRLLFEQAHQMRPSIIFFDEIDGLAPVRSSKQDQIHASIVSTLLALLDGLDDRGEIIVIGATNRIDAIDPALRRPGRFDRELYFPLPGKKEREEILKIHTRPWSSAPSEQLVSFLAEKSTGYCGSDLRMLCSEAVVHALRRRYPQIYKSSQKLLLQVDAVNVEEEDFKLAQNKIIPASCRVNPCPRARLSDTVAPLLEEQFQAATEALRNVFPHSALLSRNDVCNKPFHKPRYIVCGEDESYGQTSHFAPALLDFMEHIPVHIINLSTLFEMTNRNPEEAIIQIIREATRNPPSVIYLPAIDKWWDLLPYTAHEIFLDRIKSIPITSAVLLLGTSHCSYCNLNSEVKSIFRYEVFEIRKPTQEERKNFFKPLILEETVRPPDQPEPTEEEWEELPLAPPPPPPPPNKLELEELHNQEEQKLRELRIFLRDMCSKLARNRQFFMFTKPVDVKEVPDYLTIIKKPMDLETMMTKIDLHRYNSAQEFLLDIDLIVRNALEYNPERDPEDKLIRHRACSLRDTAYALIKAEMDTDFEEECRKISKRRKEKLESENADKEEKESIEESTNNHPLNPFIITPNTKTSPPLEDSAEKKGDTSKVKSSSCSDQLKRKRKSSLARRFLKKKMKKSNENKEAKPALTGTSSNNESPTQEGEKEPLNDTNDQSSNKSVSSNGTEKDRLKRSRSASLSTSNSQTPVNSSNKIPKLDDTPVKSCKKGGRVIRQRKPEDETILIDSEKLELLLTELVERTEDCSVETLLDCHSMLYRIVFKYRSVLDRQDMLKDIEAELCKFEELDLIKRSKQKTDSCEEEEKTDQQDG
ncbi:UNVERIFIED_CONTAM: hypothetical protein PYX00_001884 [Menopon gallinae]